MKRRIGRGFAIAALATGTIIGAAGVAYADGWESVTDTTNNPLNDGKALSCKWASNNDAYGCFMVNGDRIYLIDKNTDGTPVAMDWRYYNASGSTVVRSGVVYDALGVDNGWTVKQKDFDPGYFQHRVCEVDSVAAHDLGFSTCSSWSSKIPNELG